MSSRGCKVNFLKSNRGASVVLFAITFTVICGVAALAVDFGNVVFQKAKLQNACDSAVLAGAQELVGNPTNAYSVVHDYLSQNQTNIKSTNISIGANNREIEVKAVKTVEYFFANIFGFSNQDVTTSARARIENISSLNGARPLAVVQQVFNYGQLYTLKEGGGDGFCGNYAAIALGGSGAHIYDENLLNGYSGTISVGDVIETEPGNIAGATVSDIEQLINGCTHTPECTFDSYNPDCSRVIFIPVVDTLMVNGKKCVKVLGFATFFLEGVTSHAGQADVIGRFITYYLQGTTSNDIGDFGTYGIRLIQ